jgi:hypothetical protein
MRPPSEPDAMIESGFDRELKAALDVEPSPEFLARVRTRLASEPEPSAWRLPWLFAAAGAVAIVVAAGVVTSRFDQPISKSADVTLTGDRSLPAMPVGSTSSGSIGLKPGPRAGAVAEGPNTIAPSLPDGTVVARGFSPAVVEPAVSGRRRPEVLFSPGEMRGLRQLIALANQGDAGLESMLAPAADPVSISEIGLDEIVIAPITIEPLASDTQ